jgi:hypothetical protein
VTRGAKDVLFEKILVNFNFYGNFKNPGFFVIHQLIKEKLGKI